VITVHAVHGNNLYLGTGDRLEIQVRGADGSLAGLLRVPTADLSVTLEELDAARSERAASVARNPIAQQLMVQAEREMPPPTSRPAYADLLVDELGNVWLGDYPWTGPGGYPPRTSSQWTVFDRRGRMLGRIEIPDGLQLLEVGEGYVLALRWERTGAQSVVMYDLTR
jgi:hypothetical protein